MRWGQSPDIIFEDADLEFAVVARCLGLSPIVVKCALPELPNFGSEIDTREFTQAMVGAIKSIPLGINNPFPTLGPLANEDQFNKVLEYFEIARAEGATLAGGKATDGDLKKGSIKNQRSTLMSKIQAIYGNFWPSWSNPAIDTEEEAIVGE